MDRQSKKELLVVVEKQEEQLRRYEARLRDVVLAYKGLQKEKVALEKSLKVLSPSRDHNVLERDKLREKGEQSSGEETRDLQYSHGSNDGGIDGAYSSTDSPAKDSPGKTLGDNSDTQHRKNDDSLGQASLEAQVKTLRETLETLMEQKSKMESSFQADKKKYLQQLQTKEEAFVEERMEFCKVKEDMQRQIQDLRNRNRLEQQARDAEQNDYAMMLREMQVVVSKERTSKEGLQLKLNHLNEAAKEKQIPNDASSDAEDSKENVKVPSNKVENCDGNVDSNSSPTLLQLQREMIKMKSQLEKDILSEQLRANEAEAKASMIAKAEEQRVADLEAKLSELSDVVGKYERLRSHDQVEIQKLKERLHALNTINKESINTDNRDLDNGSNVDNENNLEQVFRKVKELLKCRDSQSNDDILESDISGFSKAELECILKNDPAHKACRDELRQLKDEFECYKSQAQNVRKTAKDEREMECSNESTEKLRQQIAGLQSTVESLQEERESNESEYRLIVDGSVREITELRLKQNFELENDRTVYDAKLQELEKQVRNQRSRTLDLISEKDCEIERLKGKLEQGAPSPTAETRRKTGLQRRNSNSVTTVNELLSQSSPTALVHYAQEQAFCEAELGLLRKQRSELEDNVRDACHREEQATEQTQLLKEEIRKLERNRSRESANLEYLKNVILRYFLTDCDSVRQQMVAAVSAILQFSPKELKLPDMT